MFSFITFNPEWSGWSAFTFWTVVISILLTLAFTFVVFFCGLSDVRFLLRALDEERVDESDDGRVSDDDLKP